MKNQLKTVLLLGILSSLLVGVGALVSPSYLWLYGALALLLNVGSYFFSDKIVLAIHRARPVSEREAPELHALVAELSERAGIPKPRVCVLDEEMPNAFATGRNPAHGVVAVTRGIQRILTPRELRGVLAHELAHIRNRDILVTTIAAVIATLISTVGRMAQFALLFGGGRSRDDEEGGGALGQLLLAIVLPIAAMLLQLAVSRSREYLADETGARIAGDPDALADALAKLERGAGCFHDRGVQTAPATASLFIVNPLRGASMLRLLSTHPAMDERIRRLRAMSAAR